MKFSIIVPVYNRVSEVEDLLQSLSSQTLKNFELVIVEDGSTDKCENVVKACSEFPVKYIFKENEGRSIARNVGMENATGDYFIFFDSDCVIPEDYFMTLTSCLENNYVDCFGGPDAAHDSFTSTQKAINYTMTSFLTTGGIRGGKISLEKFVPRTFNMGFSRTVYKSVGGFREMFSEDIDMSMRIRNAGFSIALFTDAFVYHKRRVDFKKFLRQVYVFGMSRVTLKLLYPGSLKLVHLLPAAFLLASLLMIILAIFVTPYFILPLIAYFVLVFIFGIISTKSVIIALKAIPSSAIQLWGYGAGFINAYTRKIIFRQGRNIQEEILLRKGK